MWCLNVWYCCLWSELMKNEYIILFVIGGGLGGYVVVICVG